MVRRLIGAGCLLGGVIFSEKIGMVDYRKVYRAIQVLGLSCFIYINYFYIASDFYYIIKHDEGLKVLERRDSR